jgi:hypothetical protein
MSQDHLSPDPVVAFEGGLLDPAGFGHAEHLRVAFEMTGRYGFDEALSRYIAGLRRLSARAGQPDKCHLTITVAFLALVSERRALAPDRSWSQFAQANGDLFERRVLERWYPPQVLASDIARRTFVLPPSRSTSE